MAADALQDPAFRAMDGAWMGFCYSFFQYNCLFFCKIGKTPWINEFFTCTNRSLLTGKTHHSHRFQYCLYFIFDFYNFYATLLQEVIKY